MQIADPELPSFGSSSRGANIRLAGDDIIDNAGDIEHVLVGVDAAHWPARDGVAGLLAGPMAGATEGVRSQLSMVMQGNVIAGAAVKLFATYVERYNAEVADLWDQWLEASDSNFGVDVPEHATPAEIDVLVADEAAARRSALEASRQLAEEELDVGANDVVSLLAGNVTDDVLADLFESGALPVGAAGVFPDSDFMSQVDPAARWESLVASGAIPGDLYARVSDPAMSDDTAALQVMHWLVADRHTGTGLMAAEVALLLDVPTLTAVQRRFLQGLAHHDGLMVVRAVTGESTIDDRIDAPALGRESLAHIEEGTSRIRQINDRLLAGGRLRDADDRYLESWFDAVGADNLAALPEHVDRAINRDLLLGVSDADVDVVFERLRGRYLGPVADAVMHQSNPEVGGLDGLEHQPAAVQDLATTELGASSAEGTRTFVVERVDDEVRVSIPGVDRFAGFSDLMSTSTADGGARFTDDLHEHGERVRRAIYDMDPGLNPGLLEDVLDDQLGTDDDEVRTAVARDLEVLLGDGEQAGLGLESLTERRVETASTSPDPGAVPPPPVDPGAAPPPPPDAGAVPPPPAPPTSDEPAPGAGPAEAPAPVTHDGPSAPGAGEPDHSATPPPAPGPEASGDRPPVQGGETQIVPEPSDGVLPAAAQQWLPHIERIAREAGVDPRLLTAVVTRQSEFRVDALSADGAIGLTQLMPGTAQDLQVDPHDPIANLEGGARYLRQQLDRFGGNVELALAAYNAGPALVDRLGRVPHIATTVDFVRDVTTIYVALGAAPT